MRRHIRLMLVLSAFLVGKSSPGIAEQASPAALQEKAPFALPALPYAVDGLDPAIDAETMTIHHGKHHRGYVDALNRAVASDPALQALSLEQLLTRVSAAPPAVRNNAGGHWNHSFFWKTMSPAADAGEPSRRLLKAIKTSFSSVEAFKLEFAKAGVGRFGSGWVWLIVSPNGDLAITTTPNQDNPLMDVAEVKGVPILGNDLWEHAYYLKYQNRRGDYLAAWWQVVNWREVSGRYDAAMKKR